MVVTDYKLYTECLCGARTVSATYIEVGGDSSRSMAFSGDVIPSVFLETRHSCWIKITTEEAELVSKFSENVSNISILGNTLQIHSASKYITGLMRKYVPRLFPTEPNLKTAAGKECSPSANSSTRVTAATAGELQLSLLPWSVWRMFIVAFGET